MIFKRKDRKEREGGDGGLRRLKDGVLKNPLMRPAIGGPMSGRGSALRMGGAR